MLRYLIALALIGGLALVAYLTLSYVILSSRLLGGFVRISDRQEMCEQRIAYFSLKLARPGTPAGDAAQGGGRSSGSG